MILRVIATGSSGNCYILEGRRSALVIECGVTPERLYRATPVSPSAIDGVLISHEHGDHAHYASRFAQMGLKIYASGGTLDAIGLSGASCAKVLRPMNLVKVGDFMVSPFGVRHDAAEPMGFFIIHDECGRLLFVTDTRSIEYNFRKYRPTHIMVEANYCEDVLDRNIASGAIDGSRARRVRDTHLSIEQACRLVKANETADLCTVTLIHLSSGNSNEEECRRRMQSTVALADVYVASAGLTVDLNPPFSLELK